MEQVHRHSSGHRFRSQKNLSSSNLLSGQRMAQSQAIGNKPLMTNALKWRTTKRHSLRQPSTIASDWPSQMRWIKRPTRRPTKRPRNRWRPKTRRNGIRRKLFCFHWMECNNWIELLSQFLVLTIFSIFFLLPIDLLIQKLWLFTILYNRGVSHRLILHDFLNRNHVFFSIEKWMCSKTNYSTWSISIFCCSSAIAIGGARGFDFCV